MKGLKIFIDTALPISHCSILSLCPEMFYRFNSIVALAVSLRVSSTLGAALDTAPAIQADDDGNVRLDNGNGNTLSVMDGKVTFTNNQGSPQNACGISQVISIRITEQISQSSLNVDTRIEQNGSYVFGGITFNINNAPTQFSTNVMGIVTSTVTSSTTQSLDIPPVSSAAAGSSGSPNPFSLAGLSSPSSQPALASGVITTTTPTPSPTPFLLSITPAPARQRRRRQTTNQQLVGGDGQSTAECSNAARLVVNEGQLSINGQLLITLPGQPFVPFFSTGGATPGSISTTFDIVDDRLIWSNGAFADGTASFCRDQAGTIFAVFGTPPVDCAEVVLSSVPSKSHMKHEPSIVQCIEWLMAVQPASAAPQHQGPAAPQRQAQSSRLRRLLPRQRPLRRTRS